MKLTIQKIKNLIRYRLKLILLNIINLSLRIKLKIVSLTYTVKIEGEPKLLQPTLVAGQGKVIFEEGIIIGNPDSENYYNLYSYIESRKLNSEILIGRNTLINNNFSIISEFGKITIGNDCLIGQNVKIYNSNFHSINPNKRRDNNINNSSDIYIGKNVFIGSNAIILKGTKIGDNSIIGAGTVISGEFGDNLIITGYKNNYYTAKIENDNR